MACRTWVGESATGCLTSINQRFGQAFVLVSPGITPFGQLGFPPFKGALWLDPNTLISVGSTNISVLGSLTVFSSGGAIPPSAQGVTPSVVHAATVTTLPPTVRPSPAP